MGILALAAFFALGAVMASFAGVVAGRIHTGESFVLGSSRCDACGAPLPPGSLIPVISYFRAHGRARCCGARISWMAPASELVLGALFALAMLHLGMTPRLGLFLIALTLLFMLVLYDLAHQILPPPLLALFVLAAFAFALAAGPREQFVQTFFIALAFALFFCALHACSSGRAMGLADSPLVFGLALLAGPAALPGLLFSFWVGAGVGILVLARTPRGSRMGIEVPFAPFLAAGFLLAYFTQWDPLALSAIVLRGLS